MLFLLLIQAAAQAPDIQLDARVHAREVRIERRGEATLQVTGGPGSDVRTVKPDTQGRNRLRNVDVEVHAEARIADPAQNPPEPETPAPQ
ncbi:MAG: hypothetical protein E6G92_14890 [Alphaproteobacteria bacterium]|nr:MAG: hypothetical protein E6G92_14890 [Alphaproteobacteria bacterium]